MALMNRSLLQNGVGASSKGCKLAGVFSAPSAPSCPKKVQAGQQHPMAAFFLSVFRTIVVPSHVFFLSLFSLREHT